MKQISFINKCDNNVRIHQEKKDKTLAVNDSARKLICLDFVSNFS